MEVGYTLKEVLDSRIITKAVKDLENVQVYMENVNAKQIGKGVMFGLATVPCDFGDFFTFSRELSKQGLSYTGLSTDLDGCDIDLGYVVVGEGNSRTFIVTIAYTTSEEMSKNDYSSLLISVILEDFESVVHRYDVSAEFLKEMDTKIKQKEIYRELFKG